MARLLSPTWTSVALDGDFQYLPANQPSVAGNRLLDQALGSKRSRSQMVVVLSRIEATQPENGLPQSESQAQPDTADVDSLVGLDLLRRLYHRLGEISVRRAMATTDNDRQPSRWTEIAVDAFDQAIALDDEFYE
ncbi:MAG: hypothetical protein AAF539_13470, partial [Planctomycetota bacterium]